MSPSGLQLQQPPSTYPLMGGLRSSAQMISYEIAMGLSLVAVFLYAGSMSTSQIVAEQARNLWFVIPAFFSFFVYVITMVGETNRAPFDLPEAEGELVGGFHTEYSSLKFALFFLAEYINMATVSALATTLFLGGWAAPWGLVHLWPGANEGYWPVLWFLGKMMLFIFMFIWLRGSLPRLRYDQFMAFGWKFLVPFALLWILLIGTFSVLRSEGHGTRTLLLSVALPVALIIFAVTWLWPQGRADEDEDEEPPARRGGPDRPAFPVPPMDLSIPPSPRLRAREPVSTAPATDAEVLDSDDPNTGKDR